MGIVEKHNDVDHISETYEDIAKGNLHIRLFQLPHFDGSSLRKAFEYPHIFYIAGNLSYELFAAGSEIFVTGSERCIFFCNRVRIGRSRSSKSTTLVPI